MKKPSFWAVILVLSLGFSFAAPLYATELEPKGTPAHKAQRGFLNIALSPLEVSHTMVKEKERDKSFALAWLTGISKGTCLAVGRALAGIYEVVTFPIDWPGNNYEPLVRPEYPWQLLPEQENPESI